LGIAIADQTTAVIKIGERIAACLEQLWWDNYTRLADEARGEFHRLFYHAFELLDLLASYKPLALLGWLKAPHFRAGALDIKLTRYRQLRESANKLREFERMTFEEVSDELERTSLATVRACSVRIAPRSLCPLSAVPLIVISALSDLCAQARTGFL
jgi:hypothetical protein